MMPPGILSSLKRAGADLRNKDVCASRINGFNLQI